jgi:hypothetical protein
MSRYDAKWLEKADAFLAKHNPCRITPNPNGGINCMAGHGCCEGCNHLGARGCTVQALACKLWLCDKAYTALPFLVKIELYELLNECDVTLWFRYDHFVIPQFMMPVMMTGYVDPRIALESE